MGDLGKMIITTGFKKFPKVQYIAQSGRTGRRQRETFHWDWYYKRTNYNKTTHSDWKFGKASDVAFFDEMIPTLN